MSLLTTRPGLRWAVPAGVLAVAVAAGGLSSVLSANAEPALPERSAAQLLVDIQNSTVEHFSGTVVQKAELGLPSLPATGSQGSSNLSSLVSGTHTLRVWYAGPEKVRFALLGTLGESDVIRNNQDLWVWSSDKNSAVHYKLPTDKAGKAPERPEQPMTPKDAADALLKAVDPTTKVTTDGTARVAGRDAYELVLTPRDTDSLVGQIRLAIDAQQKVPLQVQAFAKNASKPSFEIRFEQVSFAKPDADQFTFKAPKGTKVTEGEAFGSKGELPEEALPGKLIPGMPVPAPGKVAPGKVPGKGGAPTVIGDGWTSVLVLPGSTVPAKDESGDNPLGGVFGSLPEVSGSWGSGRLLKSAMFSALLTDDGRVLVGAVTPEKLYAAAADPAAKAPR